MRIYEYTRGPPSMIARISSASAASASVARIDFFRPGNRSHCIQLSLRVQSWAVATNDFTRPLVERACALAKPYAVALCTRSKEQATSTKTINAGLLVNADVSSQFPMDQGFVSILASGTPLDADCWSSQQFTQHP